MEEILQEVIFFEDGDIKITSRRVVFGQKTYAMTNIASVDVLKKQSSGCGAVAGVTFGLIVVLISIVTLSSKSIFNGIVLLMVGIFILVAFMAAQSKVKPIYSIKVGSTSGEYDVYSSEDEVYVNRISEAINQSIVSR